MAAQRDLPLPASVPSATVVINGRCTLRIDGEHRVVVVAGLPVHHYSANDAVAEAYSMVVLADRGFATQTEVARAFRCSERTVRRHQQRYADGGMTALATRSGWRPGRGEREHIHWWETPSIPCTDTDGRAFFPSHIVKTE